MKRSIVGENIGGVSMLQSYTNQSPLREETARLSIHKDVLQRLSDTARSRVVLDPVRLCGKHVYVVGKSDSNAVGDGQDFVLAVGIEKRPADTVGRFGKVGSKVEGDFCFLIHDNKFTAFKVGR